MDIDKDKLSKKFKEKDWDYVFKEAETISNFLLINKFSIYDEEARNDMSQECLENLHKKILADKIDPDKNLFAFIWANSRFRILEILRKENNRRRIATFVNYDELEGLSDYKDYELYLNNRESVYENY